MMYFIQVGDKKIFTPSLSRKRGGGYDVLHSSAYSGMHRGTGIDN
ncbi:hypothetical protein NIES3585_20640 [Nodularia sp. NIES-3585]|nr:hypothetical protein NIES3585_20640 [Nodularia sp. NIES-3585]